MTTLRQLIDATPAVADLVQAQNYPAIADALNTPTAVVNPEPQGTVPLTITLKMLLALVPAAEAAKIYQLGTYVTDLKIAIDAGDREYMAYLLGVAQAAQAISANTVAALTPLLAATELDPNWTATIAGPSLAAAAGLPWVTPEQVQSALVL